MNEAMRHWLAIAYSQDPAGFAQQHQDIVRYYGMKILGFRETNLRAVESRYPTAVDGRYSCTVD